MTRVSTVVAAAALLALAAPAFAQPSPSNPPPPPPRPTNAAMPFLMLAGEADVFEITSSQMALQKSRNADVRRFAGMLVEHHTLTTNTALDRAKAAGLTAPPAVLGSRKRAMLDQLMAAAPAAFDRVYLQQQVPAHEEALALHTAYARSGDTPQLRTAAEASVPVVTQHLEEARRLARRM